MYDYQSCVLTIPLSSIVFELFDVE